MMGERMSTREREVPQCEDRVAIPAEILLYECVCVCVCVGSHNFSLEGPISAIQTFFVANNELFHTVC